MNLSDERDVLYDPEGITDDYPPNGMERECTLCGTTDCPEPQFPPPYKHDFNGGYAPPKLAQEEFASTIARNTQVGGNWYSKLAIQPGEYCFANNLNYWQGNVIKYVTRYKDKNGAEDLRKAIHCIELLLEQEYGETPYSSPQDALEQIVDRKDYIRRSYGRGNPEAS